MDESAGAVMTWIPVVDDSRTVERGFKTLYACMKRVSMGDGRVRNHVEGLHNSSRVLESA